MVRGIQRPVIEHFVKMIAKFNAMIPTTHKHPPPWLLDP